MRRRRWAVRMISRRLFVGLSCALPAAGLFAEDGPAAAFEADMRRIERRLRGRVGVGIVDTASRHRWHYRGDERFPMCSTFKAVAVAALLARVDAGSESLGRRIAFGAGGLVAYSPVTGPRAGGAGMTLAELCEAAITLSDNTAANLILKALGGPSAVTAFARSRRDAMTRLDRWEPQLNEATPGDPRDTTTPAAMTALLETVLVGDGLQRASQELLIAWLEACSTGTERLRAGLPPPWRVGDKTGTGDHGTANDIAIVWPNRPQPWLASVFVTETQAPMGERNRAIAAIGAELSRLVRA